MKFTIARNTFIKKLNAVQRAISSKTTIPILTGLKIEAEEELKVKKRRRELKGTIGWGGGSRSYSGLYMWSRSW